jgi:hypothetical protein
MRTAIFALCMALCAAWPAFAQAPQTPPTPKEALTPETVIFQKELRGYGKLVVTCKEVELRLTPQEIAERAENEKQAPGRTIYSNNRYVYSFYMQSEPGSRKTLCTLLFGTFGKITPGKTDPASGSIEILDAAFRDKTLYVLWLQFEQPSAVIVRTDRKHDPPAQPWESKCLVECSSAADGVVNGRIIGPTLRGEVAIELSHGVKLPNGKTRVTLYRLTTDEKGEAIWWPDPANQYIGAEKPGYLVKREIDEAMKRMKNGP